ncbi:MAG TPA: alkane 1-monooxygenase [Chitinophagales bacterium]|nr:alkane 1-monooxygenase [Chitinophagales bacterium]
MAIRFLKYASVYISVGIILASLVAGGKWVFVAPIYVFGMIPLLELILPFSEKNMTKAEEEIAKKDIKYDIVVWSVVPLQYAVLFYFLNRVSDGTLAGWEIAGMIFTFGISCGVLGINVAHELGHRNTWYEQTMSKMLLLTSLYMHFFIEHNRGHHKNVSTDNDPASSRYGETIYAFFIRTVRDSWFSAWHLEGERLKKANQSFWSWHNDMLVYQIIQIGFVAAIGLVWGWKVMLFFVASATVGFLLLETVNYIEHYGLRRKMIDGAYYEKVMPIHSWNSDHPIGRIMLFELTRHSDHHYMASRKYQVLRHFDDSPQMPTGYPGMMVLAFFPPLWFNVMHKQISKYKATTQGAALA